MDSGPGVRVALSLDSDERIARARFVACRFDAARSVASRVCSLLCGATLDEAARLSEEAIARIVGQTAGSAAVRTVHFAKSAALQPLIGRRALGGVHLTCTCFSIETSLIRETARKHDCRTVAELQRYLPVCMGCGTCRPDVEDLLPPVL